MPEATTHQAALRLGAGCTIVGALAIAGAWAVHGTAGLALLNGWLARRMLR